jgi:hypothetical protein
MSLPTFKFKPDMNSSANIGLMPEAKLKTSGVIPDIISSAREKASSLEFPELPSLNTNDDSSGDSEETSFFSFIIRMILIAVIVWFMWVNLANNSNLGDGSFLDKISGIFKTMEENGKVLYARITGNIADYKSLNDDDGDKEEKRSDNDDEDGDDDDKAAAAAVAVAADGSPTKVRQKRDFKPPNQRRSDSINENVPVPISMTNSSEKKPGFHHEDTKYTFLDKAIRNYSGPSPLPDDSTSRTQKHQSGKAGYCYIGEDRGFRSCIKVEAGDKCMSGEVYNTNEICMNPTLRE